MTDQDAEVTRIHDRLRDAMRMIDEIAGEIIDSRLDNNNIRGIGEALVSLGDITFEIYRDRPDLIPEHLDGIDFKNRKPDA